MDVQADAIDLLAFTGHKSLYRPMGTGGLVIGERVELARLEPLKRGGTGSRSQHEEQPDFLPDMAESGTLNVVGLAGLAAGVRWVQEQRVEAIRAHEVTLANRLVNGLQKIPGVTVYGGLEAEAQTATVSFNVAGMAPSKVGLQLDEEHGCSAGWGCIAPRPRTERWVLFPMARYALAWPLSTRPTRWTLRWRPCANWRGRRADGKAVRRHPGLLYQPRAQGGASP